MQRLNYHFCDKSFSDKSNLNKHVTTVHEEKKPFKCNICDAGFVSEGDFCVSSFTKKNNLKNHVEVVKVIKQKIDLSIFI